MYNEIFELANSYIKISRSYVNQFKSSNYATLNPKNCDEIVLLGKVIKGNAIEGQMYETLYPNILGPLDPMVYYHDKPRIVFILKEDFIEAGSFFRNIDPDRGGLRKAEDIRNNLQSYLSYPAIRKMRNFIGQLLLPNGAELQWNNLFLHHTALLNVCLPPGLAFNSKRSNNTLIRDWSKITANLIEDMLEVLEPSIVIGGNVLDLFMTDSNLIYKLQHGESIDSYGQIFQKDINDASFLSANNHGVGLYKTDGIIWVQEKHPSFRGFSKKQINDVTSEIRRLHKLWFGRDL